MNLDYYLKQATEADKDLVFAIKKRSIKPYVEKVFGWDDVRQRQFVDEVYKMKQIKFIVIDEQPVGFLQVEETDKEIFLANLLIVDEYQDKGLGRELLQSVMKRAGKLDKPVRLEVFTINERAQQFYQRHGFRMIKKDNIKIEMIYLQHEYSGHHH
jgi:ribosomal protein S18 acetylase RimI-like enzyme